MGYKEILGIKNVTENKDFANYVFNKEIDEYFKEIGFIVGKMRPHHSNGVGYKDLTLKIPALVFVLQLENEYVIHLFISPLDAYMEMQTPWGSYESSRHYKFDSEPKTIKKIEDALDFLTD